MSLFSKCSIDSVNSICLTVVPNGRKDESDRISLRLTNLSMSQTVINEKGKLLPVCFHTVLLPFLFDNRARDWRNTLYILSSTNILDFIAIWKMYPYKMYNLKKASIWKAEKQFEIPSYRAQLWAKSWKSFKKLSHSMFLLMHFKKKRLETLSQMNRESSKLKIMTTYVSRCYCEEHGTPDKGNQKKTTL